MRTQPLLFILAVALICGCTGDHFTTGHGDVGQFILQQAMARGGSPVSTNLPSIEGTWRYSTDKYGVIIQMPRDRYSTVESFLHQAFGQPKFGPSDTTDGGKAGGYRLTSKGGAISFSCDTNHTEVIILRPFSEQEFTSEILPRLVTKMDKSQ